MNYSKSLFAIGALLLLIAGISCTSLKNVPQPCKGNKYETDKKFYRARFVGQSLREDVAMKMGKANAREELATQMRDHIRRVNHDFLADYAKNLSEDLKMKFVNLTIHVIDIVLYNSYSICEDVKYDKQGGFYKYWSVMEMSKDEYVKALNNEISKDDELEINFEMNEWEDKFWGIHEK